ncbi:thioredoxin family protein [Clostridium paraputrificum]|uniref:thioredoxin family protein n=1 Tax=Clostridium TaxID=1485 RepID=UPI003D34BF71
MNFNSINEINNLIKENPMVLLCFYGDSCGVCTVVSDALEKEMKNYPNIKFCKIFAEDNMEVFAKYDVFTLPVVLFYIDGKEYLREARNISIRDLLLDIDRLYSLY